MHIIKKWSLLRSFVEVLQFDQIKTKTSAFPFLEHRIGNKDFAS